MKLMKLLTVGRSLNGGKSVSGHYKIQKALPKFSSTARPSQAAVAKAALRSQTPLAQVPTPLAPTTPAPMAQPETERPLSAVHGMDKTQKIPAGTVLKRQPEPSLSVKNRFAALVQKQIAALKKRFFPARSKKKSGAIPMQTEMNLEKITVVRNDLSEADLEVVSPKSADSTFSSKVHLPDLDRVKNTGRQWIKMTSQLFKTSSPFAAGAEEESAKVAESSKEDRRELAERI